jgi:hypothetical protein
LLVTAHSVAHKYIEQTTKRMAYQLLILSLYVRHTMRLDKGLDLRDLRPFAFRSTHSRSPYAGRFRLTYAVPSKSLRHSFARVYSWPIRGRVRHTDLFAFCSTAFICLTRARRTL